MHVDPAQSATGGFPDNLGLPSIPKEHAMSNEGYHEPIAEMTDATRDMHRALVSLMEELEAVDWYNQRVDAARDPELKKILAHNRDEEKEHAAMLFEWIRCADPTFSMIFISTALAGLATLIGARLRAVESEA
jgi:hypothetical protein